MNNSANLCADRSRVDIFLSRFFGTVEAFNFTGA